MHEFVNQVENCHSEWDSGLLLTPHADEESVETVGLKFMNELGYKSLFLIQILCSVRG